MHSTLRIIASVVLCIGTPLVAQSLTGRVVDSTGTGIPGVDIIMSNGAPQGVTDSLGNFTITGLNNRVYSTLELRPSTDNFVAKLYENYPVSGATNLGTVTLLAGARISGTVTTAAGAPVNACNMSAYSLAGVKYYTPNDSTNALGNWSIVVPIGTIVLRTTPPAVTSLVTEEVELVVTGAANLGTNILEQGYVLSGNVVDSATALPIASARFVAVNALTGEEVFLPGTAITNAFGAFSLLVPRAFIDLEVTSPTTNPHAAKEVLGIPVVGATSLGQVRVDRGVVVTGTVTGPSGPVLGADIDVFTTDGYKLFTPNDNTSVAGVFSVVIPPGTYTFTVEPLIGSGLCGARTAPTTVSLNGSIGTIPLAAGVPLSLAVTTPTGPVAGINLDAADPATGTKLVLSGDESDALGNITTFVPAGTWNLSLVAPEGNQGAPVLLTAQAISAATTLNVTMPSKQLVTTVSSYGVLTIPQGGYLPVDLTLFNPTAASVPSLLDVIVKFSSGAELPVFPTVPLDVIPGFPLALQGVWIQMPVVPATEVGRRLRFGLRFRDPVTNLPLDTAYTEFVVQ